MENGKHSRTRVRRGASVLERLLADRLTTPLRFLGEVRDPPAMRLMDRAGKAIGFEKKD